MGRFRHFTAATICALASVCMAQADTNAVTVTSGYASTGLAVGAGFSFIPKTNLIITSIQLYDAGLSNAVVRFWNSSNTAIGAFVPGPTSNTYGVFTTNRTFVLGAGIRYSITVQDGLADGSSHVPVELYLPGPGMEIKVAPDLTDYYAVLLATNQPYLTGIGSNAFLFGVNFSYITTNLIWPQLTVQPAESSSVIVSWPPSALDSFVLQTDTNLAAWDWHDRFPIPPGGSWTWTTTNVNLSPATNNLFFRLRPALH